MPEKFPTVQELFCRLSIMTGERIEDIEDRSLRAKPAAARHVTWWAYSAVHAMHPMEVERQTGNNYRTVIDACKKIGGRMQEDPILAKMCRSLVSGRGIAYDREYAYALGRLCTNGDTFREMRPEAPKVKCPHKAMAEALAGAAFESHRVTPQRARRMSQRARGGTYQSSMPETVEG